MILFLLLLLLLFVVCGCGGDDHSCGRRRHRRRQRQQQRPLVAGAAVGVVVEDYNRLHDHLAIMPLSSKNEGILGRWWWWWWGRNRISALHAIVFCLLLLLFLLLWLLLLSGQSVPVGRQLDHHHQRTPRRHAFPHRRFHTDAVVVVVVVTTLSFSSLFLFLSILRLSDYRVTPIHSIPIAIWEERSTSYGTMMIIIMMMIDGYWYD